MNRTDKGDFAQNLWRGESEIRLEEEISFPDYCSDVVRLLTLEGHAVIDRCRAFLQDGAVNTEISGTVYFTAVYLDEDNECNSYSFSLDFSDNRKKDMGRLPIVPESLFASVVPVHILCNPKVLSPRKLLARCEVKMMHDIFANLSYSAYNSTDDVASGIVDVEESTRVMTRIAGRKHEGFSLSEQIKLPATLPSVEKILSSSSSVEVGAVYPSADEVSIEGTMTFKVLYLSEEDEFGEKNVVTFYQPLEFKNTLSLDDSSESSVVRVSSWSGNTGAEISTDTFGENRVFTLNSSYTLSCLLMENNENVFVKDAYGIGGDIEVEVADTEYLEFLGTLSEKCSVREEIAESCDCESVENVKVQALCKGVSLNAEGWGADLKVEVSALGKKEGAALCTLKGGFDMRVLFNFPDAIEKKLSGKDAFIDVVPVVQVTDCRVLHGALEVLADVSVSCQVYKKDSARYIKSLEYRDGEKKKNGLRFYYPTSDDTLWSVGKRYGVSREKLRAINSLESDTLLSPIRIP